MISISVSSCWCGTSIICLLVSFCCCITQFLYPLKTWHVPLFFGEKRKMSEPVRQFTKINRKWEAWQHTKSLYFCLRIISQCFNPIKMAPHPTRMCNIVISHLNHMPLKEALRRSRLDLEKRCILEKSNALQQPHASSSLSSMTNKLVVYMVFSIFLGCMIIFS